MSNLPAPKRGRSEVADPGQPGLVVRVTPNGVKTWSVLFYVFGERRTLDDGTDRGGPQRRLTLGKFPSLSLEAARAKARAALALAAAGKDPREEREEGRERRRANSFAVVVPRFLAEKKRTLAPASYRNAKSALETHVLSQWGGRALEEIARRDVHALLDSLRDGDPPRLGAAREVRKQLSGLFNWAVDRGIVDRSPVTQMRRDDLRPNKEAGRALSDPELRAVWLAAESLGFPFGSLYQCLLLTGARLNEVARARWADLDDEERTLVVPRERFKSRRDHLVVLPQRAFEVASKAPRFKHGEFIFSTTHGLRPVSGFRRASDRLRSEAATILQRDSGASLEHFRIHDLRVTVRTRLSELRVPVHISELILGHSRTGLLGTYDKSLLLEERRGALEAWAAKLAEIVGD